MANGPDHIGENAIMAPLLRLLSVFSGTPRDGHGHHQASAILGKEAYFAAADKNRFPDSSSSMEG